MDALDLSNKIREILNNKKAVDVNINCIKDVSALADYFVFATGTSNTHVNALAEEVEFKVKEMGISTKKREADNSGTWILLDYGDVIVHIFTDEMRKLYNIEQLWEETKKKLD